MKLIVATTALAFGNVGITFAQSQNDATPATKVGEPYVSHAQGDWQIQCLKSEGQEDPCQMFQGLNGKDGNPMAEITIFRLPLTENVPVAATVGVPLETLLTAGILLSVDGAEPKQYPYSYCNPVGCYARVGFRAEEVTALKKGSIAKIGIVPMVAQDRLIELDVSLKGFTAALSDLKPMAN